jgi:hypothetical protein
MLGSMKKWEVSELLSKGARPYHGIDRNMAGRD